MCSVSVAATAPVPHATRQHICQQRQARLMQGRKIATSSGSCRQRMHGTRSTASSHHAYKCHFTCQLSFDTMLTMPKTVISHHSWMTTSRSLAATQRSATHPNALYMLTSVTCTTPRQKSGAALPAESGAGCRNRSSSAGMRGWPG